MTDIVDPYAAIDRRESSLEPSSGTSPARVTRLPNVRQRHVGDRLEHLLVGPAGLERLLVLVPGRRAIGLEHAPSRTGAARPRARRVSRTRARGRSRRGRGPRRERVRCSVERAYSLPWCSATASAMRCWVAYGSAPWRKLGAKAGVGAQHGRRAGEHADEVGKLAAAGERALQDRDAALRRSQLVVDLEPAFLGLHRRFTFCTELTGRKYSRPKGSKAHSKRSTTLTAERDC